jgi:ribosomal protein S18 acetylase RimI-like enzyme
MPCIVPIAMEHIAGFREAVGSVARERLHLALVDTPSLEWATELVTGTLRNDDAQFVALEGGRVVGWCSIIANPRPGFGHSGSVAMGVVQEWRHRGLGRALLEACIHKSMKRGLARIELEVYAGNAAAIALYHDLKFVDEGVKRKARFLDGRYEDILVMARLFERF